MCRIIDPGFIAQIFAKQYICHTNRSFSTRMYKGTHPIEKHLSLKRSDCFRHHSHGLGINPQVLSPLQKAFVFLKTECVSEWVVSNDLLLTSSDSSPVSDSTLGSACTAFALPQHSLRSVRRVALVGWWVGALVKHCWTAALVSSGRTGRAPIDGWV